MWKAFWKGFLNQNPYMPIVVMIALVLSWVLLWAIGW